MEEIQRVSPVSFKSRPIKTAIHDHWKVALEYEAEGGGPHLIDLSHRSRCDIQHRHISEMKPWGVTMPENPGQSIYQNGILINRMNRTQASAWHLDGARLMTPEGPAYTDVTDAALFLALLGKEVFSITEKLTYLDLSDPEKEPPFLLQGPFSRVPCQLVVLGKSNHCSGVLLTCSRGYGQDMVEAIFEAGAQWKLRPAGESAFHRFVEKWLA
ncbi:MAG: hypothetical protein V3W19_01740 [Desulfatiglandales bacterium]